MGILSLTQPFICLGLAATKLPGHRAVSPREGIADGRGITRAPGADPDSPEPPARLGSHDRRRGPGRGQGEAHSAQEGRHLVHRPVPGRGAGGQAQDVVEDFTPTGGTPRTSPGANTLPGGPCLPGTTHSRRTGSCRPPDAGCGRRSGRREGLAGCSSWAVASEGRGQGRASTGTPSSPPVRPPGPWPRASASGGERPCCSIVSSPADPPRDRRRGRSGLPPCGPPGGADRHGRRRD